MKSTRVLVLRADAAVTAWMREPLQSAGHEVTETGMDPRAIETARVWHPHVAIFSLSPRHTYVSDLIRALREVEPALRVLVVCDEGLDGLDEAMLADLDLEGVMRMQDGPLGLSMWMRAAARSWRSRMRERRRKDAWDALLEVASELREATCADDVLRGVLSRLDRLMGVPVRAHIVSSAAEGQTWLSQAPASVQRFVSPLGDMHGVLCVEHPRDLSCDRNLIELLSALTGQALEMHRLRNSLAEDDLTSALTRETFYKTATGAIQGVARDGGAFTLAVFDIDHFKQVNDENGHLVGDHILRDVTAAVRTTLRPNDFVGRFGGDEFLIGLRDTCGESASGVLDRLRRNVRDRVKVADRPVTISCGATAVVSTSSLRLEARGAGQVLQQLLAEADRELYVSKARGRDTVTVSDDMLLQRLSAVELVRVQTA